MVVGRPQAPTNLHFLYEFPNAVEVNSYNGNLEKDKNCNEKSFWADCKWWYFSYKKMLSVDDSVGRSFSPGPLQISPYNLYGIWSFLTQVFLYFINKFYKIKQTCFFESNARGGRESKIFFLFCGLKRTLGLMTSNNICVPWLVVLYPLENTENTAKETHSDSSGDSFAGVV